MAIDRPRPPREPTNAIPDQSPTVAIKRSVTIAGHATSIALEAAFWTCLDEAACANGMSIPRLIATVDAARGTANLSSALRVHLLAWSRAREACGASTDSRSPITDPAA